MIYEGDNFYLMLVMEVGENDIKYYEVILGVDLGVVNIATTSDNEVYKGTKADEIRERYTSLISSCNQQGHGQPKNTSRNYPKKNAGSSGI